MAECKSFKPVISDNSKVLILGSMPGVESLQKQQYYAHKRNRFWALMGILCKREDIVEAKYDKKLEILLKNNFALFDTIKNCERKGSLDCAILNETPNDIKGLIKNYKNIKAIFLNGNKAYSALKKHFPDLFCTVKCFKLPSTSPANARYNLEKLANKWKGALDEIY